MVGNAAARKTQVRASSLPGKPAAFVCLSRSSLRSPPGCSIASSVTKAMGSISTAVEHAAVVSSPAAMRGEVAVASPDVDCAAGRNECKEQFRPPVTSYIKNFLPQNMFSMFSRGPRVDAIADVETSQQQAQASCEEESGVDVYMMLPLDTVTADGYFRFGFGTDTWFHRALAFIADSGVHGVAVDVWWGAVETAPRKYNWQGYRQLVQLLKAHNLKLQVVLSFHACGGNVNDVAQIPLPSWVLKAGEADTDLFYMDQPRDRFLKGRNKEVISLFADMRLAGLGNRTPMECYEDFMKAFSKEFAEELTRGMVSEVVIGSGPCGELRYPSYPEIREWRFPGQGEFQCYDRRAHAKLSEAADKAGHPEWGMRGPHNAGHYNDQPTYDPFFKDGGSWESDYGQFFLSWYSQCLLDHGEALLQAAHRAFRPHLPHPHPPSSSGPPTSAPASSPPTSPKPAPPSHPNPLAAVFSSLATLSSPFSSSSPAPPARPADPSATPSAAATLSASASTATLMPLDSLDLDCCPDSSDVSMTDARPLHRPSSALSPPAHPFAHPSYHPHHPPPRAASSSALPLSGSTAAPSGMAMDCMSPPPASTPPCHHHNTSHLMATSATNGGYVAPGQHEHMKRSFASTSLSSLSTDEMLDADVSDCMFYPPSDPFDTPLHFAQYAASSTTSHSTASSTSASATSDAPDAPSAPLTLTLKLAGVHWWYNTRSHAAELTAGYYNTATHDGYRPIVQLCAKYGAQLTLTCVEMRNSEHDSHCAPEDLLRQIRALCAEQGVPLGGENALCVYGYSNNSGWVRREALDQIVAQARPQPHHPHLHHQQHHHPRPCTSNIVPVGRRLSDVTRPAGAACAAAPQPRPYTHQQHAHQPAAAAACAAAAGGVAVAAAAAPQAQPHGQPAAAAAPTAQAGGTPALRSLTVLRLEPALLGGVCEPEWKRFMAEMNQIRA